MSSHEVPPLPTSPTQVDLFIHATTGFNRLLDNDVEGAQATFALAPNSAAHNVGIGITSFLQAALGMEDAELSSALDVLVKAEERAQAEATLQAKVKETTVYPKGLEYKILVADAVLSQALVHVLTESYVEFMKAIYKLNRAYKAFKQAYGIVFPKGVSSTDSLDSIFTTLNAHYLAQTSPAPSSSLTSSSSSFFSWGRSKKTPTLSAPSHTLHHSASTSTLAPPRPAGILSAEQEQAASAPGSRTASRTASTEALPATASTASGNGTDSRSFPPPAWKDDPLTTLVISGASFGFGMFGLVFSLLPPKMRKLISWFGFGNSNRAAALKLLTVAASTGNDVHGYFASLTLLTFYGIVLLMSGYQADEEGLLHECGVVLDRIIDRFPDGTLWVLNRAKLARYRHDTPQAIKILEDALTKGSTFREADSLLCFELSWCLLSAWELEKAADRFEQMCLLNNWSHATYVSIALGCMLDLPAEQRTPEVVERIQRLFDKLPTLFGLKRLLGEPPTTEMFIIRRLEAHKVKHARWVSQGRLEADSPVWHAVRITNAMELGLFWATIGGRSPLQATEAQIAHLTSFTPYPLHVPNPSSTSTTPNPLTDDLDTVPERCIRDLLLGALYRSLATKESLEIAQGLLEGVRKGEVGEERWTGPFALFELAVVECRLAEVEEKEGKEVGKAVWKKRGTKAKGFVEELLAVPEYDLKSRLESRAMMLRDEITTKMASFGLS